MNNEPNNPPPQIQMPNFSSYNKLHSMLGGEQAALVKARDIFARDLRQAQAHEKQYCEKFKQEPVMTNALFNTVCGLVDRCKTFYEVEALARYVLDDNFIPDIDEVRSRARALKAVVPIWDYLKANPNCKRSY